MDIIPLRLASSSVYILVYSSTSKSRHQTLNTGKQKCIHQQKVVDINSLMSASNKQQWTSNHLCVQAEVDTSTKSSWHQPIDVGKQQVAVEIKPLMLASRSVYINNK